MDVKVQKQPRTAEPVCGKIALCEEEGSDGRCAERVQTRIAAAAERVHRSRQHAGAGWREDRNSHLMRL
jgi:hypothetical protein